MTARRMAAAGLAALAMVGTAVVATGRGDSAARRALPGGGEPAVLDPADFTTRIDNPYWPMRPGSRWVYRETTPDGTRQRVVVTVTRRTRLIANGVTARVVRDVATDGGEPVEVTDDWYAQDRAGNVWYLGEATTEYENGRPVSTAGSFEAGVDGAQAGVIMPARPRPGLSYRQEYYAGRAEDRAVVVSLRERVEVPFGHFRAGRVLMTRDLDAVHPRSEELKLYARGVGPVLAIGVSGGADREDLVSYSRG
jgi:hypothetical protein